MSTLLNKTRMLNKILQKSGTEPVVFDDICTLLSDVLMCNVYIVSRKGKILGHNFSNGFECEVVKDTVLSEGRFPEEYNSKLLNIHDTVANLTNKDVCVFDHEASCENEGKLTTLVPIVGNRERLGTLLLARFETKFTDEDLVLAEYSATIVGLEILRSKQDEIEEEARKKALTETREFMSQVMDLLAQCLPKCAESDSPSLALSIQLNKVRQALNSTQDLSEISKLNAELADI